MMSKVERRAMTKKTKEPTEQGVCSSVQILLISLLFIQVTTLFTARQGHGRSRVSQLQFYAYYLHTRDDIFSTVHRSGRLFQEWLVDAFAQIENNRLQFHRLNQDKLRADLYSGLQDAILGGADLADIGQRIILPSTFIGSPRHMVQQYQDAMAIVRDTSNPDLFITFTANPQWPEITAALLPGQTAQDRPDIVARIFKLNLTRYARICSANMFSAGSGLGCMLSSFRSAAFLTRISWSS
jgi:hypothetical protein